MTLGPDLLLDPETHDLVFRDGDVVMEVNVAQAVKIALLFVTGEWFLDRSDGVPYFSQIFTKAPNLDHIAAIYRKTILAVPGVKDLLEFSLDFTAATRELIVRWKADTDEGEIGDLTPIEFPA